ncbi:hypothetical protein INR49_007923 [Caranx melampygus]|nr:hypothetical protein INR49_007923 [Caranx melampygus]
MITSVTVHLSVTLLLSLCVCGCVVHGAAVVQRETVLEVRSESGEDVVLPCTAVSEPGVQYLAERWYKVLQPPESQLNGLLTRDLPNGTTRWYTGVEREVELLGEGGSGGSSILLPEVTCSDDGWYACHLAAPVGEQNREGLVILTVKDCATARQVADTYLVIFASLVLVLALIIFLLSYASLKNVVRGKRNKTPSHKEVLLNAAVKPLEKKDLQLIYTLGPKPPTLKHICV